MSLWRKLVVAFWIFFGVMVLWSFYDYNRGLTQQAVDHPVQEHFYFFHTNAPSGATAPSRNGPDIVQTAFVVQPDTPAKGSFTCLVTLKNLGGQKATGIQVNVRPYRGTFTGDVDVGGPSRSGTLSDDDPIAQIGDWLSFPDLAPGESSTQSDVFFARSDVKPGLNPKPNIIFEAVKPAPATPASTPPRRPSGP